ncbi:MAG: OsmC family protein [Rhodobacteraceae bacterium]|nr:OsmC family protein [Paracoccaceae bacterium]
MVLKVKPKRYGPVFVIFDGGAELRYADGEGADSSLYPPAGSPVETMLAALGACIVRSLEWTAGRHKLPPFQVRVAGVGAPELPGRLETAEVAVIGRLSDDAALAGQIVAQAKSACTVSNSMNSVVTVRLEEG